MSKILARPKLCPLDSSESLDHTGAEGVLLDTTPTKCSRYHVLIPAAGVSRRLAQLTDSRPKSLLEVEGKSIIKHSLDTLNSFGFRRVTFVVGYMRELFMETLGTTYRNLTIDYVVSHDYASTEHGWSLYQTRDSWQMRRSPVVFMDADNLYHPLILKRALAAPHADVVMVDDLFGDSGREEELVLGRDGIVTALERGRLLEKPDVVGGFVGINCFSPAFMDELYSFMEDFFNVHGRNHKYERVIGRFLEEHGRPLHYVTSNGLPWINVNNEEDYARAPRVARMIGDAEYAMRNA